MSGELIEVLGKTAFFNWGKCPKNLRGETFTLKSEDGEAFDIDAEALCMARRTMEQAVQTGSGVAIELPFKKAALAKVVEYLNYHEEIKPFEIRTPLESDNLVECGCSKWDATFINMDKELLFDIMVAALTMDIPSMYFLAGAKATLLIKGKEPSKLIKDFKLSNDLPDDEEEQLSGLFTTQKEKVSAYPDESGFGGVAVLMNAVFQAAERNGVLAPSKTEDPTPSAIPLKSYRHASWRSMILSDWKQFRDAPEEVLADRDLFFACVAPSRGAVLEWAPGEFREDRALILEAVKYKGSCLAEADMSLRSDRSFVMEAIEVNGEALEGASDDLRADEEFILGACSLGKGSCMKGAKDKLKSNKAFVLQAACKSPEAFKFAADDLRNDADFVLQAVTANGLILQYVPRRFQSNRVIAQAAVSSVAEAAYFVHPAARAELGIQVPHDGEPWLLTLKKEQDKSGVGGKRGPMSQTVWAREPLNKEQAAEDGIVFHHVKSQKIVQFSALSTMTANMGQSNYVAANCYLDKMPFFERPETDAVTLMWGAVGNIGMRWKAFASQDMLNANPEALMNVSEAAKVLTMTATRMDPPEWYAGSFFDEWTRQSMLMQTAGVHSGGGFRPGENYQAISTDPEHAVSVGDAVKQVPQEKTTDTEPMNMAKAVTGPLGGWPTLFEEERRVDTVQVPAEEIYEGMRVQLHGLNTAKNGLIGVAVKMCKEDKWKVRLDKGENALLKAEYLVPAPPPKTLKKKKQESEAATARQ